MFGVNYDVFTTNYKFMVNDMFWRMANSKCLWCFELKNNLSMLIPFYKQYLYNYLLVNDDGNLYLDTDGLKELHSYFAVNDEQVEINKLLTQYKEIKDKLGNYTNLLNSDGTINYKRLCK